MDRLPAQGPGEDRFEVLPLGKSEEEAARLNEPTRLTVTCSPKLGPDRSVEVAARLRAMGHRVTPHVAARMVRDAAHLDELLSAIMAAGLDDVFVIGGDADPPLGEFASAVELLPLIAEHPQRPRTIGIGGYPEGHPKIDDATLARALLEKSRLADYVTTQLCFDPDALRAWIRASRASGMEIPVLIGMPGQVKPAKLLELSARIGVGPSMTFLRKQRGLRGLLQRGAAERLYRNLKPDVGDPELQIAGFHYYTFNELVATYEWQRKLARTGHGPSPEISRGRTYANPEESKTT